MDAITTKKNRSRAKRKKSTGILIYTRQDALGFAEALARYVDLPSSILGQFYNLRNHKRPDSRYYLERLTALFHETEDFPASRCLLFRPAYQDRHGLNREAIYRKALGLALVLHQHKILTAEQLNWINTTHLMQLEEGSEPSVHDQEVAIVASSIELEARRDRGYFTHLDILSGASDEAKNADSPLSVPVPKIEFHFEGQPKKSVITDTHFRTDNLFGLPVDNGANFFWLEHDRSTEVMLPSQSLRRTSWLQKILLANAISMGQHPIYETYLGIPNLRILATFQSSIRQAHFNDLVRKYGRHQNTFASTVLPPIDFIINPTIIRELYHEPVWSRPDGTRFSLKERR